MKPYIDMLVSPPGGHYVWANSSSLGKLVCAGGPCDWTWLRASTKELLSIEKHAVYEVDVILTNLGQAILLGVMS